MNILNYPTLGEVLMVEDTIKSMDFYPSKKELWENLPKKVQYQTFKIIIDYLLNSNKILIDKRRILWTFNPERIKKLIEQDLVVK